jgi:predicted DNA-binding protein YlxM (UPF0122 family)
MMEGKELKEQIRKRDCSVEEIAKNLNLSVEDVEAHIEKFGSKMAPAIPDKLKELAELSREEQELLLSMTQQTLVLNNPSSRPLSRRDEANAITCFVFRNGYIEEMHRGSKPKISEEEMKKLTIEFSAKLQKWLEIRDRFLPEKKALYDALLLPYREAFTRDWE